jgi:hypothetical protein
MAGRLPCLNGLERVKGIEPSYAAWEAAVLPLNYTRAAAPALFTSGRHDEAIRPSGGSEQLMLSNYEPDTHVAC